MRGLSVALVLVSAACSRGPTPAATASADTAVAPPGEATQAPSVRKPGFQVHLPGAASGQACGISEPLKSDDACAADADCGPSDPCHAHACVAAAKAKPRGPQTMCTEIMDCRSVDANDCRCFEGRCALLPRR